MTMSKKFLVVLCLVLLLCAESWTKSLKKNERSRRSLDECYKLYSLCSVHSPCEGSCDGFPLFCYMGFICTIDSSEQPYRKRRSLESQPKAM